MSRPTLQHIADAAGVSLDTASRVLSGRLKGSYPKVMERAAKIEAIAKKLGYRADSNARAMAKGSTDSIGLLISLMAEGIYVPTGIIRGAERACAAAGKRLMIAQAALGADGDTALPAIVREHQVDGIVLTQYLGVNDAVHQAIKKAKLPVAWLNDRRNSPGAHPDDLGGAAAVTTTLLSLGHQRIAYVHFGDDAHYSVHDRKNGYCAAMKFAGLQPVIVESPWHSVLENRSVPDQRLAATRSLLTSSHRPTAIVCYSLAEVLCTQVIAASLNIEIPRQLAITGFHESPLESAGVAISTLMFPAYEIGFEAVRLVLAPRRPTTATAIPYASPIGNTLVPPLLHR